MSSSLRAFVRLLCVAVAGAVLASCQDQQSDSIGPHLAKGAPNRTLTITGGGTGFGAVTVPGYGENPPVQCDVDAGVTVPSACTRTYLHKTQIELTATPDAGSTFSGWSGACSGTSPVCRLTMNESRNVRASFTGSAPATYTLTVTGSGTGSGTVHTQSGLAPAINCTISAGTAAASGCTATYVEGTAVTLSGTPESGHTFTGWTGACTGTTCQLSMTANRAVTAEFTAPPGPEVTVGRWDPARSTPVIGVHLSRLFNGRLLLWGHAGEAHLWDGPGSAFVQVPANACTGTAVCEYFCAGHTFLADGTLLIAGGHNEALGNEYGIKDASVFNGTSWQATGSMVYPRWYPTLVTLANGEVLALAGNSTPGTAVPIPERYNGSTWTELTGINVVWPMYPRAFVEPKLGRVYVFDGLVKMIDPSGVGSATIGPYKKTYDRYYGAAVMLDSKVLYVGGGGAGGCPTNLPRNTAEVIDLAAATPVWNYTGSMQVGRRHHNATVLPDGTVMVNGGTSLCGFNNESGAVYSTELWNPATGSWTQLAASSVIRVYHSTSILLDDGRVVSMGSGDANVASPQLSYEVFSPPYLFKGPRPGYTLPPGGMHYGQPFVVNTPQAASIRKVTIIRLPSTTHAIDMGQRLNTLTFEVNGTSITITPPAEGKIAPPGPYRLFLINDQGVPSIGQAILLGQ